MDPSLMEDVYMKFTLCLYTYTVFKTRQEREEELVFIHIHSTVSVYIKHY
jgi:hypothetical protein